MKRLFSLALPLIVVGLGLWLSFIFGRELLSLYSTAEPEVKLGVMTASGGALAFLISNAVQSSRERRARLFEAKREAYGEFFEAFPRIFEDAESDLKLGEEEMLNVIKSLRVNVMTWGSAPTVNAFGKFMRENASDTDVSPRQLFLRTEEFLRALRKDLGHDDATLDSFALTKLILHGSEHHTLD